MKKGSRASKQRERILVAAAKLFRKKSYLNTTIDDIAHRLKINKAMVYYYFKDKSHVLYEVMCSAIDGYIERAREVVSSSDPIPDKMKALVKLHVNYETTPTSMAGISHFELKNLPRKLAKPYISKRDIYEQLFRNLIHAGISEGYFDRTLDPEITARFILGLTNSITTWFRTDGPLSSEDIGEKVWEIIARAIQPNPDRDST
jgi:AcrR family transcriptional regulator